MAVTVTYDVEGPGKGRQETVKGAGSLKIVTGQLSFDNNYPTNGEDISAIWGQFRGSTLHQIMIEDPTGSAGTGKKVVVNYDDQLAVLYTNASPPAEVANASDQSGAADLRFTAIGPA